MTVHEYVFMEEVGGYRISSSYRRFKSGGFVGVALVAETGFRSQSDFVPRDSERP